MSRRRNRRRAATVHLRALEDLVSPEWTRQQRADFEAALPLAKAEVNVAVAGITGSGKSALINALCGARPKEEVEYDETGKVVESELHAPEGDKLSHETQEVASYEAQKASLAGKVYTITVWDSPGLEDGTGRGYEYMQQLRKQCSGAIDILLYCINVSLMRGIPDDMVPGMAVVTQTLGQDIWRHAIVVLTFANVLEENIKEDLSDAKGGENTEHVYASRIDNWKKKVNVALQSTGVPEEIAKGITVEPAGHCLEPSLPDRPHWLGYLWLQFLICARDEAKLAILITNQHRIRDAKHLTPTDLLEEPESNACDIPIVVDRDQVRNAVMIGTGVSMGVASAAGACVGGVAGGVFLGTLTAGVGVGAGLAVGAAVGAVIGPLVGMAVNKTLRKGQEKAKRSASLS